MLLDAWRMVQGEDLSHLVEREILGGVKIQMPAVEDLYYWYLKNGCKFVLAERGDDVLGILVYHQIFENVIAIRMLYAAPGSWGSKVGKGLVAATSPKRVLFQTRKDHPPQQVLKLTESVRRQIDETEKLITWEMEWRK